METNIFKLDLIGCKLDVVYRLRKINKILVPGLTKMGQFCQL